MTAGPDPQAGSAGLREGLPWWPARMPLLGTPAGGAGSRIAAATLYQHSCCPHMKRTKILVKPFASGFENNKKGRAEAEFSQYALRGARRLGMLHVLALRDCQAKTRLCRVFLIVSRSGTRNLKGKRRSLHRATCKEFVPVVQKAYKDTCHNHRILFLPWRPRSCDSLRRLPRPTPAPIMYFFIRHYEALVQATGRTV